MTLWAIPTTMRFERGRAYKKVGELMMDAIRGVETQNVDVDLECERDEDGNWTEADSVADEITNALMS